MTGKIWTILGNPSRIFGNECHLNLGIQIVIISIYIHDYIHLRGT